MKKIILSTLLILLSLYLVNVNEASVNESQDCPPGYSFSPNPPGTQHTLVLTGAGSVRVQYILGASNIVIDEVVSLPANLPVDLEKWGSGNYTIRFLTTTDPSQPCDDILFFFQD
jgi:hypothetical protein